jgi:glutamate/tyrosine decarboxylase-like PLP-dependent enzyme
MFSLDADMADLIFGYCRQRLELDPVPLDYGGTRTEGLAAALGGLLGPHGHDAADILDRFAEHLATAHVSVDSPRYLSFIPAAPTKAALLFDMVVSCSSLHGTSWLEAAGPVAAENQALGVLAELAGLPAGAGGCFVSGGSAGNLSALVVGRDMARYRPGGRPERPRVAVGEETHASVANALHILGVEPLVVPSEDHRLTGRALRAVLDDDRAGPDVVAVVATAGTTNAGIVDDLDGIGAVAAERSLWFHVDGAYGAAAIFAPSARERLRGLERADSLVVDPHKWLFAPFDCAALLYREPRLAKAVHTQNAAYLDVVHDPAAGDWNPSDYAFHLTRRARGLPLWFSLAVNGTEAYRSAIEGTLELARRAAALIDRTPHVELLRAPELSVVLFGRPGWDRADYLAWSARLLADQVAFVTPTTWEGATAARFAFLHPDTTLEMVEAVVATMR